MAIALPNPFSALEPEMVAENGRCPGLADPPVAAAGNFVLDEDRFFADIGQMPLPPIEALQILARFA